MGVSVANPSTGGAVVSPGTAVEASSPPADGLAVPGTAGVLVATGQTGPPGKSAYQVAVENGFVGTEAEWLAMLADEPDVQDLTIIFENGLI
jgi:hypothetical protein